MVSHFVFFPAHEMEFRLRVNAHLSLTSFSLSTLATKTKSSIVADRNDCYLFLFILSIDVIVDMVSQSCFDSFVRANSVLSFFFVIFNYTVTTKALIACMQCGRAGTVGTALAFALELVRTHK